MSDDGLTGPVQISAEDKQKWYHRMKDIAHMLHQRNLGFAVNVKWKSMMADFQEQLIEDETWPHDDPISVWTHPDVKETDIMATDPTNMRLMTFAQANNSTAGFGRYKGLLIPQGDRLHEIDWKRDRSKAE